MSKMAERRMVRLEMLGRKRCENDEASRENRRFTMVLLGAIGGI